MTYLTESQLRSHARSFEGQIARVFFVEKSIETAKVSIFLSHSHQDRELVEGLINWFAMYGIRLYVDWQDSSMPRITSGTTAEGIKNKIRELDYFLVLATRNCLESRWTPWEIGFADGIKPLERIAIIPVRDPTGDFCGSEYLQIYRRIIIAKRGELAVFEPNRIYGSTLKAWLTD